MRCTFHWMNRLMRLAVLVALLFSTPLLACFVNNGNNTDNVVSAAQQPQPEQPKQTDEFVPISQLPPQDQLPAAPLLVTAYAFVWMVLFGYLVSLARRMANVQREVERLESDIAKRTST
jgi:CcmD family protein